MVIIPGFYINITGKCNMQCEYCPKYGEDWEPSDKLLDYEALTWILKEARNNGILSYRISGGEPMLFPTRVFEVLNILNNLGIDDIILNTNGYNLFQYLNELNKFKLQKLKISLDTLDPDMYKEITGSSEFYNVMNSIKQVKEQGNHYLEINMVVIRKNFDHVWDMIDFCINNDVSLKLLDLVYYDNYKVKNYEPNKYFFENYTNLDFLYQGFDDLFGKPSVTMLSSGRGIPMQKYKIGKTSTLTIKNSHNGSTFAELCTKCPLFPCQEGLFNLSLSSSGKITPCRLRNDIAIDLCNLSPYRISSELNRILLAYKSPFHQQKTIEFPN
jgi:molybdenum cofactor biosynthesis enzyme MoaA